MLALTITCIIMAISVVFVIKKFIDYSKSGQEQIKSITIQRDSLFNKLADSATKNQLIHDRIIDLENAIDKNFGVSTRNEIVEVKCEFTKLDLVVMMSGLNLLISRNSNTDDVRHYLKLIDKINEVLPRMKEDD